LAASAIACAGPPEAAFPEIPGIRCDCDFRWPFTDDLRGALWSVRGDRRWWLGPAGFHGSADAGRTWSGVPFPAGGFVPESFGPAGDGAFVTGRAEVPDDLPPRAARRFTAYLVPPDSGAPEELVPAVDGSTPGDAERDSLRMAALAPGRVTSRAAARGTSAAFPASAVSGPASCPTCGPSPGWATAGSCSPRGSRIRSPGCRTGACVPPAAGSC